MKLINSFSTQYSSGKHLETNLYCFTLSAYYAKKSGFNIILYTDNKGKELFKYSPYDEIIVLDNLNTPNIKLFAYSKFIAMGHSNEGDIHIDGDVFLKKDSLKDLIHTNDCDIIVQSVEHKEIHSTNNWNAEIEACSNCHLPSFMNKDLPKMYNCGIVGFKNKDIMKEYHDYYFYLSDQFIQYGKMIDAVPELIIEQQLLYDFAKYKNLKVKEILDWRRINTNANEIGYQHLLGKSKYKNLDKVKTTLKKLDINLYNKINKHYELFK